MLKTNLFFQLTLFKQRRFTVYIKRFLAFAFVLALVGVCVGLSGCERVAPVGSAEDMSQMSEVVEIPIGVVVALTGQHAEPYGLPMQRGFELAREEINALIGINMTFVTADDQSTVDGAKAAVEQLVDQGVPAMVGIAISTQLKDAFPIAEKNGVVAFSSVSSAAGLSSIGDFIFRAPLATDILVPNGVAATQQKLGYKKVATIYDDIDVYSTSSDEELRAALQERGVEILTTETFETGDTDFSQQLTNIMNLQPEALFISALAQEMAEIIIQARSLGIPETTRLIVPDLSGAEIQIAGDATEGAITFTDWFAMSETPGNQTFIQNYRAKYGFDPEPWAAKSYATLYILADAIRRAGATDSAAIRDALAETMDFPTILGNFSFDANGEAVYAPIVLIVKDGEFQVFE